RALRREVDDVGGQALRRCLEGDARAGGVFEEEVDDRLAAQRRELLDLAGLGVGHVLRDVEDPQGVRARERARVQEVPHARAAGSSMLTYSSPSSSRSRTFTRSVRADGMFFPMKSGRIGS